ncbi:MAG: hypothetical protein ILO68_00905, partial [Clostridia bacterium]|nr:hypothetical protein [Clostridia bacterium]
VVRVQYLAGDFITIPPYGDGTYRFTMPARNVTLYADYECTGHQWDIIYRWTDDGQGTYSCHASSVCPWCYAYFSEYGTVTSEVIPQSCLDSGYLKYTATFEDPRCETQTHLVVTGPPLGHDYSNPSWDWVWREADNYYTVTMTVVCENDPSHVITKNAAVSLETTPETYTYTASAEADGHTLTDVKVDKRKYGVTLNAGEHGTLGFGFGTGPEYEVGSSFPLTISIDDGYSLSSLSATGASGDPVRIIYASLSSGQIILAMPAEPVTVSATFGEPKTVTFDGDGKAGIYMVTAEGVRIAESVQTEFKAAAGSEITISCALNDIASRVTGVQATGADSTAVTAVNVNKSENYFEVMFTMPDQPVTVKVLTEPADYPVVQEGLNPITIPEGEESGIFVFVPTTTGIYRFETFTGINIVGKIMNRERSEGYEDNGWGMLNLVAPLQAGTTYYLMLNTFDMNPSVQYDNLSISRIDNAYLVTADPNTRNGSVSVKIYPESKPLTNELPAEMGQEIEVVPEAKPGCAVERVTYQIGNGSPVEIPAVNGRYVFTVPASDVTVSATFIALQPVFSGHQLVLSGQIGVRFGMELNMLSDAEKQASYVEFTVQGNTTRMDTSEAEILPAPDGRYVFTCYVNSIQMAETVTAVFHSGEYAVSDEYSVEAYIRAVDEHASQFSATVLDLTHGIADYGYHAQQFLSEVNHWTIGEDYAAMTLHYTDNYDLDQVKQEVTSNELAVNKEGSDVTGAMTRLVMATTTSLDIRMTVTDNSTLTASAEVHGETYEAVPQSDGSYMISIPNIKASRLGETVTVTGNAGGAFTIQASPFSFVYSVLTSTTANERMKKAMAAMYYFYQTATAYQAANP